MEKNSEQSNQAKLKCAQLVLDQVVKFYKKANIPTITHKKAAEEIIKVAEKNYALRAISIARRSSEATKVKLEKEESELAATFQM